MQVQNTLTIGNQSFALVEPDSAHIAATGKTATDRKMNALQLAHTGKNDAAIAAISHGTGKVAAKAREIKKADELQRIVDSFARGNLAGLAQLISATLGESVKFAKVTDAEGNVVRSAWDAVSGYVGVLENKLLQLQDKGKEFTAKGDYTAAAYTLHYLLGVVRSTLARKAAIVEENKKAAEKAREQITNG
jgi:hypothetical protein